MCPSMQACDIWYALQDAYYFDTQTNVVTGVTGNKLSLGYDDVSSVANSTKLLLTIFIESL